jgi:hypothetical protein
MKKTAVITILVASILVTLLSLFSTNQISLAHASPLNASEVAQSDIFPIEVVVIASEYFFAPSSSDFISAYTYQDELSIGSWLGDFSTGSTLLLHALDPVSGTCLVQGLTIQGWESTGWVNCSELSLK